MKSFWPCLALPSLLGCQEPAHPSTEPHRGVVIRPAPSSSVAAAQPGRRPEPLVRESVIARLRDPRRTKPPRDSKLLVAELMQLEQLFAASPSRDPARLRLLQRLGEDYDELARAKKSEPTEPGSAVESKRTEMMVRGASLSAWERYQRWLGEAHDDPATDEILYHLALNHEQAGRLDQARRTYFQLIQSRPTSPLLPPTYLAFGELFLQESEQDISRLDLARQSYEKTLEYPPSDNRVYALALVRLAQIARREGDPEAAEAARKRAADHLDLERDRPETEELRLLLP